MNTVIRLRPWQKAALDAFGRRVTRDFLVVATPGAGKTTFALAAVAEVMADRRARRVVIVAPTTHLKAQWADAALRFGIQLDPNWSPADGSLPADVHGVVITYQAVGSAVRQLSAWAQESVVVFDEIHHAGDDKSWGSAILDAFDDAPARLALSGTPFRSDGSAIPFIDYVMDEARPDVEYGYSQALTDGRVVRPIYFPTFGGEMEWIGGDGVHLAASFDDALDTQRANQRLRAALDASGSWIRHVLEEAHTQLVQLRQHHPEAGGLVIAIDQQHAEQLAQVLRSISGTTPVVAVSDDPEASLKITRFAAGDAPWVVAVKMISEGVDIPRLRLGVFASTTTTELFFRQAVGRLVRWTEGVANQKAFMYLPDDPRLRRWAVELAESRRHSLKLRQDREFEEERRDGDTEREQMSLFEVISSIATEQQTVTTPTLFDLDHPDRWNDPPRSDDPELDHVIMVPQVARPPIPNGVTSLREHKERLREANAAATAEIARYTGLDHRQINGELNRRIGLSRVAEATAAQLAERLDAANLWLRTIK